MLVNEDFQPCVNRQKIIAMDREGNQRPVWKCAEETAEAFTQPVTPEVCQECPVRSFVMQKALKAREYTPPGFRQLHKINWEKPDHDPEFLPCGDRVLVGFPSCCGRERTTQLCNGTGSKHLGHEVTPTICENCPVRS